MNDKKNIQKNIQTIHQIQCIPPNVTADAKIPIMLIEKSPTLRW